MKTTEEYRFAIGLRTTDGAILPREVVIRMLANFLPAFSVVDAEGYWNGKSEPSVIVIVLDVDNLGAAYYETVAQELTQRLRQDTILVMTPRATDYVEVTA